MSITKFKKYIMNPALIVLGLGRRKILSWMSDEIYIKIVYRMIFGKKLNLDNPLTFNEKIQWLKLYNRNHRYTELVDKNLAKERVAEIIGNEYIIPTLGVWDKAEDIDFDALPNQFVLKCNHDSGGVVICKNKQKMDKKLTVEKLTTCLKHNGYWYGREWPYKNVKPCVIAEQYICDENLKELRDYKFFCFNGRVKCFKVDFGRFVDHHANYYDRDLNIIPFGEMALYPKYEKRIEMPDSIGLMIQLAEKIAGKEPFLRVDFYDVNGKVYFGEVTFFPSSGFGRFTSAEWDFRLGEWIELPTIGPVSRFSTN